LEAACMCTPSSWFSDAALTRFGASELGYSRATALYILIISTSYKARHGLAATNQMNAFLLWWAYVRCGRTVQKAVSPDGTVRRVNNTELMASQEVRSFLRYNFISGGVKSTRHEVW